jgi:hypothetical protein
MFIDILNTYLKHYNSKPIEGIFYNGFRIKPNAGSVSIIDNTNNTKHVVETIKEARELIDSICSGC